MMSRAGFQLKAALNLNPISRRQGHSCACLGSRTQSAEVGVSGFRVVAPEEVARAFLASVYAAKSGVRAFGLEPTNPEEHFVFG